MKIRKTNSKQRTTYTYIDTKGNKTVLRPGENGVTEVHIKLLHAADDAEVYNNIKNAHPIPTNEERKQRTEWEKLHPGEKAPANWNLSLDTVLGDEDGSETLGDTIAAPEEADNYTVIRLREIVAAMSECQQQVYQLHYIEGFTVKETAAILGISSPAVTKQKHRIIEIIKKNFERG